MVLVMPGDGVSKGITPPLMTTHADAKLLLMTRGALQTLRPLVVSSAGRPGGIPPELFLSSLLIVFVYQPCVLTLEQGRVAQAKSASWTVLFGKGHYAESESIYNTKPQAEGHEHQMKITQLNNDHNSSLACRLVDLPLQSYYPLGRVLHMAWRRRIGGFRTNFDCS